MTLDPHDGRGPRHDPAAPGGERTQPLPPVPRPELPSASLPVFEAPPPAAPTPPAGTTPSSAAAPPPDDVPRDAASGRWSAKRTALTAGVTIVLTTVGAIGVAAAVPQGSTAGDGFGGRGRGGPSGFPGFRGGPGARGGQLPGIPQHGTSPDGSQLPVLPHLPGQQRPDGTDGTGSTGQDDLVRTT